MLADPVTRLATLLPLRLRSCRQLAREALRQGAIQKPSEFGPLLRLVRAMKPAVIVEIGCADAGSAYGFRLAAPDAVIESIDVESERATIRGDSHDLTTLSALRDALGDRAIDVLFIDGDHSYEGVRADFETFSPLVKPGGIVAFHDILPHPNRPEFVVHRYWRELSAGRRHREFVDPSADWGWGQWGGIGVIFV